MKAKTRRPTRTRKTAKPASTGSSQTRDRILDAARRLVAGQHPAALSVAQIAREAGVSHRTVYRYFPTKEALIAAVAERPAVAELNVQPRTYAEAAGALRVTWGWMGQHLDVLRGERAVPGGIELRKARIRAAREMTDRILLDAGLHCDESRANLVEIVVLLTSSGTLLELVDRHGQDVDDAVDLVLFALDRLLAGARAQQRR